MRKSLLILTLLCLAAAVPSATVAGEPASLLEFTANNCMYCKQMESPVGQLRREGVSVQVVNVDGQNETKLLYGLEGFPTFIAVYDGMETGRFVGAGPLEKLRALLRHEEKEVLKAEKAVGHFAAVVRIYSLNEDKRVVERGSGVVVHYADKVFILTVKHVIDPAKSIVVGLSTGQRIAATVKLVDNVWDCAVLTPEGPLGIEPACLAFGEEAALKVGEPLESCGLGPDTKLAGNCGAFLGLRSTPQQPTVGDWIGISGHARPGDSGGPVFNAQGHVVAVLWGGNGQPNGNGPMPTHQVLGAGPGPEVFAVQPGRLHANLAEAAK